MSERMNARDYRAMIKEHGESSRITLGQVQAAHRSQVRNQPEHDEQVALFEWAEVMAGRYPEISLLFAIPNGGHRSKAVAGKLKAEGVKPGVPDVFLPVPRKGRHGLWIEMKVGKNSPTPNQLEWIVRLRAQGYQVEVCYSVEGAVAVILKYLGEDQ